MLHVRLAYLLVLFAIGLLAVENGSDSAVPGTSSLPLRELHWRLQHLNATIVEDVQALIGEWDAALLSESPEYRPQATTQPSTHAVSTSVVATGNLTLLQQRQICSCTNNGLCCGDTSKRLGCCPAGFVCCLNAQMGTSGCCYGTQICCGGFCCDGDQACGSRGCMNPTYATWHNLAMFSAKVKELTRLQRVDDLDDHKHIYDRRHRSHDHDSHVDNDDHQHGDSN